MHACPLVCTRLCRCRMPHTVQAPIDDKTKALLLAAVVLLGGVGVIAAGRATVSSLQSRISSAGDGATKLVVAGAFWLAVFFAARFVLEL